MFEFQFSILTIILGSTLLLLTVYLVTLYRNRILSPVRLRRQLEAEGTDSNTPHQPVSVIVYARDNSARLEALLSQLLEQEYKADYEVIVVNDSGGYECNDVVTRLSLKHRNLRMTFVPDNAHNLSRKKLAITLGLKAARYPFVLLLNAECRLRSNHWLAGMAIQCDKIILGQAVITPDDSKQLPLMCRLDQAYTAITWINAAIHHRAYRGNGYNIGYPTAVFFAKDGFSGTLNLQAGDDDLFVKKVASKSNTAVQLTGDTIVDITTSQARRLYHELKVSHMFTGKQLPAHPLMSTAPVLLWVSLGLAIAVGMMSLPNLLPAIAGLLLLLVQWIMISLSLGKSARACGIKMKRCVIIPALLALPLHNMRYRLISQSNKSQHYTWQRQKMI